MNYEERKRWLCQQCGKPHQCGYVNRGLEDDCTALQEWMQCWELGYQDAIDKPTGGELLHVLNKGQKIGYKDAVEKACEFFEERMWEMRTPDDNYLVIDRYAQSKKDFIEQFKKYVKEQL